jgi:cytochrome c
MHKVKLNLSVLMAGVFFSTAALAIEAPAAPAVAAPAAAVEATSPAPAAPTAVDAAAVPAQTPTDVVVAPAVEEKPTVLAEADALALFKKSNCLVCHSIQKKVVGPAYKDVAAKYHGQADAEAKLFAKVTTGGKGVWGSVPMPAQKANPEDIKSLIRFVLSLQPVNIAKTN